MNVDEAFVSESRVRAERGFARIRHCLEQLGEEDLSWRPAEGMNSIANLILHVCGNLRQWIGHGAGGLADVRDRDRDREFGASRQPGMDELRKLLDETAAMVDESLRRLDPNRLLDVRRIQDSEQTVLGAIYRVIGHLDGHGMQIVYVTRMRKGGAYRHF